MQKMAHSWFHVRDVILGLNFQARNVTVGLCLAKSCQHDDARWFCSLFEVADEEVAEEELVQKLRGSKDRRGVCFLALMLADSEEEESKRLLLQSAFMGDPLAQAHLALTSPEQNEHQSFEWASNAARHGEPLGYLLLSHCLRFGVGCRLNKKGAFMYLKKAARAGSGKKKKRGSRFCFLLE